MPGRLQAPRRLAPPLAAAVAAVAAAAAVLRSANRNGRLHSVRVLRLPIPRRGMGCSRGMGYSGGQRARTTAYAPDALPVLCDAAALASVVKKLLTGMCMVGFQTDIPASGHLHMQIQHPSRCCYYVRRCGSASSERVRATMLMQVAMGGWGGGAGWLALTLGRQNPTAPPHPIAPQRAQVRGRPTVRGASYSVAWRERCSLSSGMCKLLSGF